MHGAQHGHSGQTLCPRRTTRRRPSVHLPARDTSSVTEKDSGKSPTETDAGAVAEPADARRPAALLRAGRSAGVGRSSRPRPTEWRPRLLVVVPRPEKQHELRGGADGALGQRGVVAELLATEAAHAERCDARRERHYRWKSGPGQAGRLQPAGVKCGGSQQAHLRRRGTRQRAQRLLDVEDDGVYRHVDRMLSFPLDHLHNGPPT